MLKMFKNNLINLTDNILKVIEINMIDILNYLIMPIK